MMMLNFDNTGSSRFWLDWPDFREVWYKILAKKKEANVLKDLMEKFFEISLTEQETLIYIFLAHKIGEKS